MPRRTCPPLPWRALALALLLGAAPGRAADAADPDWPCIQRRVPHLSLGQVWQIGRAHV